jgi:serine O-acetyltransferase
MCELIRSIQKRDPANPTYLEVLLAYNGFHAIVWHRMNNFLWRMGFRALPRVLANMARIFTGVEIHPEAKIGQRVFIDHGTGVVIGQTAILGDDVTLYHGVTLGGVGRTTDTCAKRHPTIENGAMIGAGAQVLGNITVGKGAKVGSNSVVTNDIPDGTTALGIPARVIGGDDKARGYGMPSRAEMEDVTFTIDCIIKEMGQIKQELNMEQGDCSPKTPRKKATAKPKKTAPKKASKAPTKKT